MSTWDVAKVILRTQSPVAWLVAEGAEAAAKTIAKASEKGLETLQDEVAKQNLQMQFAQQQARIAQELAIARRIDNAEEVEIEEFYDTAGKGNVGLSMDLKKETASIGLGAEGRLVTKRVYHFKGWRTSEAEVVTQVIEGES